MDGFSSLTWNGLETRPGQQEQRLLVFPPGRAWTPCRSSTSRHQAPHRNSETCSGESSATARDLDQPQAHALVARTRITKRRPRPLHAEVHCRSPRCSTGQGIADQTAQAATRFPVFASASLRSHLWDASRCAALTRAHESLLHRLQVICRLSALDTRPKQSMRRRSTSQSRRHLCRYDSLHSLLSLIPKALITETSDSFLLLVQVTRKRRPRSNCPVRETFITEEDSQNFGLVIRLREPSLSMECGYSRDALSCPHKNKPAHSSACGRLKAQGAALRRRQHPRTSQVWRQRVDLCNGFQRDLMHRNSCW